MDRHHPYRLILIFTVFLFTLNAAHADRVVPSERVSSYLNVRSGPGTDNAVISTLDNDDSAALLGEVPFWYHVRLDSGDEGYASKAWSTIIPADTLLRLGAWNIKKLGHNNDKDFATVAQIIEDHFDILAVVEVMQKQRAHPGYDELMATLGRGLGRDGHRHAAPAHGFGQ